MEFRWLLTGDGAKLQFREGVGVWFNVRAFNISGLEYDYSVSIHKAVHRTPAEQDVEEHSRGAEIVRRIDDPDAGVVGRYRDEPIHGVGMSTKDLQQGIQIEHLTQIGGAPYLAFVAKAWNDLLDNGFSDLHIQLVNWDDSGVFAVSATGQIVGCITYVDSKWTNTFGIKIGFIDSDYRGIGLYRRMWDTLVERASSSGVAFIDGTTRTDNHHMRDVGRSLGRVEESVNFRYRVGQ